MSPRPAGPPDALNRPTGGPRAMLGPATASAKESVPPGTVPRILRLFAPHRASLLMVLGIVLVIGVVGVISPLVQRDVIDKGLFSPTGVEMDVVLKLCGILLLLTVARGLLQLWQTFLTAKVGQRVLRDIRTRLFEHLQSLSLRFFTGTRTGEIQSRLQNDVGGLQTVVSDTAATYVSNIVALISTIIAMLLLSWQLTVVSVIALPVFIWSTGGVGRWRRRVTARTQESLADMSAITEESLSVSGVLLAKSHGQQRNAAGVYRRASDILAGLLVKQQMISRGFFIVVTSFFGLMPLLVFIVTAWVNQDAVSISVGTLVTFIGLQTALFFPLGQLLQSSTEMSSSLALFGRIFDYLDEVPDIVDAPNAVALPAPAAGRVEFDNVQFSYAPKPRTGDPVYALKGVSFTIEPGMLAAFVGPSGAGKTTISYLVPRLYEATSGAVRVDDHDVRDITQESLAEAIGMVTQESYLFHATIRDNLKYSRPDATDEQVEAAARAAQIHERILSFDEGYDTVVGERGYRLSGGEKQRLAIARVILKDPRILILDEATSALDTTNERLVQAALRPLMSGRTTIAIAHRLSTIRAADVIFAVEDGEIVEHGNHDELLALGGVYARLYDQQFGGGAVEARFDDGIILSDGHVISMGTSESTKNSATDDDTGSPPGKPGRLDDAAQAARTMPMG